MHIPNASHHRNKIQQKCFKNIYTIFVILYTCHTHIYTHVLCPQGIGFSLPLQTPSFICPFFMGLIKGLRKNKQHSPFNRFPRRGVARKAPSWAEQRIK